MGRVISVTGKGGVGKTTISSLVILQLCRPELPVLAVDADPNYNLGDMMGVQVRGTIGSIREQLMRAKDDLPQGISKQELVDYQIRMALQEEDCFDLMTMGRQEGPGCYCYINSILRSFIDELVSRYAFVVIDNEAGLEHLSRRTTAMSDLLLIVSDPTPVSLRAAGRIARLSDEMELKIGRKVLVLNRSEEVVHELISEHARYEFDSVRRVRSDPLLERLDADGVPLVELTGSTPAVEDVRDLLSAELQPLRLPR